MGTLLAQAAEVSQEQAEAMPWKGVASLEDTLTHIVTAERYWLELARRGTPGII